MSILDHKLIPNCQSYRRILYKLFDLIVASFCFGKFAKISENVPALQNVLLITQPAFTRSKLTIETLEQGLKYVQS